MESKISAEAPRSSSSTGCGIRSITALTPGCKTYEIIAEVIDTDGVKYICPAVKWVKDGLAFNQDSAYQTGYEIYKNGSIIYKSESL